MRRVLGILLIALVLSPGLFWRDPPAAHAGHGALVVRGLPLPADGVQLAPGLTLARGWRLDSRGENFGGYSALLSLPGGVLLALSDRGRFLRFSPADPISSVMGAIGAANSSDKRQFDIEAATRDPARGTTWLGYENSNAIRRSRGDWGMSDEVRPPEMRGWPSNSGPEALVRLGDGRFLVLSEALAGWQRPTAEGLLFPDDPVEGAQPVAFRFVPPDGFRPTDSAQLPDGRVVILLRKLVWGLPPGFVSRLVVANPATIAAGAEWAWEPLAEIADPLPAENYEGLAVEPLAPGRVRLWLISDDNSAVLQRTVLLALDWDMAGANKARAQAAKR